MNPFTQKGGTDQTLQMAVSTLAPQVAGRWRNEARETVCLAVAAERAVQAPMADTMDIPREEVLLGRCCECGIGLDPRTHPTMTCVNCLQARADIAEGVCPNGQLFKCRRCQRYCGGATTYVACEPESRELMAICLKRVRGLKRVRVADAAWIWTEPHSMRLKVR